MNITITRNNKEYKYKLDKEYSTILDALEYIKENIDNTLSYRSGCKSGICGSCAVIVNESEKLACKSKIDENDKVKPLKYCKVIKDLVVEINQIEKLLKENKTFIENYSNNLITNDEQKLINIQSNCILCQSCYSSCPVVEINKEFKGPYALTRSLRYINDKKESNFSNKLDEIQRNGIWDCTLCGNCTLVCPQFIDPKTDIMNLRMKSIQNGYSDPNIQNNNFFNEFDFDSGFNPNSF